MSEEEKKLGNWKYWCTERQTDNTNRPGSLESAVHSILTEKCAKTIIPLLFFICSDPDRTHEMRPQHDAKTSIKQQITTVFDSHSHLIHDLQIYQLYNIIKNACAFSNRVVSDHIWNVEWKIHFQELRRRNLLTQHCVFAKILCVVY